MPITSPVISVSGLTLPLPGSSLQAGNVVGSAKIAEKTIELTTCAQFGALFDVNMVWFGLTQAQERQYGFDAATDLGGRAFILQFKVSSTVPRSGRYIGQRRFGCQHHQMERLVQTFGALPNACYYFLPDFGFFNELTALGGNVLGSSYLVDVAGLPNPVPATTRKSGYHYAYLDSASPAVTITSEPFKAHRVTRAVDLLEEMRMMKGQYFPLAKDLLALARNLDRGNARLGDLFYRNAVLAVLP